ncbi:hypothetical protein [Paenibacillus arenilitoris]|uniref:Uncharacterized protein n=1 Tax=Paenibacillus arenilitoris TaxID=2772299 RepID=A0A927CVI9_9BACL|nr:hypothetical protein [Paenibacillus arenilitoris]MBD2872320.1 hypothetical protein [Paenibacillus arenilitoris]
MKTVNIPPYLYELFGRRTSVLELSVTLFFSAAMSAAMLAYSAKEWLTLAGWKVAALALLLLDINGGVIANFTASTNRYYRASPGARYLFILVHVQPLLLAWLLGEGWSACLFVWLYAAASALIVNACARHYAQRTIGAALLCAGIGFFLLQYAGSLPKLLLATLLFYLVKVAFAFAVDHDPGREDREAAK